MSRPPLHRAFGSEDGPTRAALDVRSARVVSDVFAILRGGRGLRPTREALIGFASADPRMETGCVFCKFRAGKHPARLREMPGLAFSVFSGAAARP